MSRLGKLLYVDVTIRTSGFPWLLGLTTALLAGYGVVDINTVIAIIVSITGLILVQGYEHALDTLHDVGGYSAFREEVLAEDAKKYIKRFPYAMLVLLIALVVVERWWLILTGIMAVMMGRLYVKSHNEWYAVAGFMLAHMTGYFSATNTPSLAFLAGFIMTGFIYKASLSMYRLDDYLDGELPSKEAIIQYYRNIFRYTLHYVAPLTIILLVSVKYPVDVSGLQPFAAISWIVGWGLMFLSMLMYKAHYVNQEAPVYLPVAGIMIPELVAAYKQGLLIVYVPMYLALWIILMAFWMSRHAMCNITGCPLNPLLSVERPR
jgi:hypothetical protein